MRHDSLLDALAPHAARLAQMPLSHLLADDPARADDFALRVGPLYANFARQKFDRPAWQALLALGAQVRVDAALHALIEGDPVNVSECRPALHTALRSDLGESEVARRARTQALAGLDQMQGLIDALAASEVTDIINVGIGGSDLGPRLAVDALRDFHSGRFRIHFLANVDGHALARVMAALDPARTAVLLVSKSFRTQETLLNGAVLRDWLGDARRDRLFAVSARPQAAVEFGVPAAQVLAMAETVGGRYSMWSTVGFAIALALGMPGFRALLNGAAQMDRHVLSAPPAANMAVWHALSVVWNRNALGFGSHAVLPYDERLRLLPDYLQQLIMESLGKSARCDGSGCARATGLVLWGGVGSSSQHSFFQSLHQGTDTVPVDFIGVVRPAHAHDEHHAALLANLLAQSEALANGRAHSDPHRHYPGDRPSSLFLLDALNPDSLGHLIALYEHSTYLQAVLWGINAFDQWGVELGKQVAEELLPAVRAGGAGADADPVTAAALKQIARQRGD